MDTPSETLTPDVSPTHSGHKKAAPANEAATRQPENDQNIVVTGFMGTGKTTVGRRLADLLRRPFIDTDVEIAQRAGKSIPQIFAEDGEFVFRAMERELCVELAQRRGLVIATGGGMLVDEGNRALMLASGFVVCLDAAPNVIGQRLAGAHNRPLASNWQQVLEKRRAVYAAIPLHVDTSNRSPDAVAREIVKLWQSQS